VEEEVKKDGETAAPGPAPGPAPVLTVDTTRAPPYNLFSPVSLFALVVAQRLRWATASSLGSVCAPPPVMRRQLYVANMVTAQRATMANLG
jgi:hypothetical protein